MAITLTIPAAQVHSADFSNRPCNCSFDVTRDSTNPSTPHLRYRPAPSRLTPGDINDDDHLRYVHFHYQGTFKVPDDRFDDDYFRYQTLLLRRHRQRLTVAFSRSSFGHSLRQ